MDFSHTFSLLFRPCLGRSGRLESRGEIKRSEEEREREREKERKQELRRESGPLD